MNALLETDGNKLCRVNFVALYFIFPKTTHKYVILAESKDKKM